MGQNFHLNLNTFLIALGFGGVSALVMGLSHYVLMPLNLHKLTCYVIGSACCLGFASWAAWLMEMPEAILLMWVVWGMTGGIVAFSYYWDKRQAKRREAKVHREINNANHSKRGRD
jgi:phosphate/sulfate permease